MNKRKILSPEKMFSLSWRDTIISFFIFLGTLLVCFIVRTLNEDKTCLSMFFILGVFLISRYTNGYFYGTIASFLSIIFVNYYFTYPYYCFNFTITGYPLAIGCMLVVSIITSAMTTQIKSQHALSLAAELEKTRSNLLRAMSHDLRTPLTSILGACSAISENHDALTKEEKLKLLSEISEEAQWLIRMVENLLIVTKIDSESGSAQIHKSPEAVEEIVSEAVQKSKKRFPEQNVTVTVPQELLIVPMDAMLIEQVIINLLENAFLHSQTATSIVLSVTKVAGFAVFEVSDNGKGIDKELLPHIFEGSISRNDSSEGADRRSMGIGLSLCNSIITAHGGTMTARNKLMGGAVFRFTLPLEEH